MPRSACEVVGGAGQAAVAERVDEQDARVEAMVARNGFREAELDEIGRVDGWPDLADRDSRGEVSGDRREDVAPMERMRHRVAPKRPIFDRMRRSDAAQALGRWQQESVVQDRPAGRRKESEAGPRPAAPLGANSGIDHGEVHADRLVGE